MAGTREEYFDKISHDAEFLHLPVVVLRVHGQLLVRLGLKLAAWNIEALPNALRDFAIRKMIKTAAHVAPGIAILQPPRQHLVKHNT